MNSKIRIKCTQVGRTLWDFKLKTMTEARLHPNWPCPISAPVGSNGAGLSKAGLLCEVEAKSKLRSSWKFQATNPNPNPCTDLTSTKTRSNLKSHIQCIPNVWAKLIKPMLGCSLEGLVSFYPWAKSMWLENLRIRKVQWFRHRALTNRSKFWPLTGTSTSHAYAGDSLYHVYRLFSTLICEVSIPHQSGLYYAVKPPWLSPK